MKTLITNEQIVEMCKRIGGELSQKFKNKNPLVVCVLKGAAPFHCELIKHMNIELEVDYLQAKSYEGTTSTNNLKIIKDLESDILGRDVIIVEDIVDTGLTLSKLKKELLKRNPSSLTFVAMLDKPSRREVEFNADFVGQEIDNLFVIGFGLDYNEKFRNLKDICIYE